uniref:HMA domain-containing protein n=1 Tax=Panagrolaimus sp. PS1159 TaxID=55785 RepID=A0AC35F8J5_9BILA
MPSTYTFNMVMTCEGCAGAAKRVLGKLGDKVLNVETDVSSQTVRVTTDLSSEEILTTLKKTGKEVSLAQ